MGNLRNGCPTSMPEDVNSLLQVRLEVDHSDERRGADTAAAGSEVKELGSALKSASQDAEAAVGSGPGDGDFMANMDFDKMLGKAAKKAEENKQKLEKDDGERERIFEQAQNEMNGAEPEEDEE